MKAKITQQAISKHHHRSLQELANLVNTALPLAHRVESDEFTPEEREELRRLTCLDSRPSHAVFELSNALTRLCGEAARRLCSRDPKVRAAERRRLDRLGNESLAMLASASTVTSRNRSASRS